MHFAFENRDSGKFSLTQISDGVTDVISFPREFHVDLTLIDVDPLKALTAALLLFEVNDGSGLINAPSASLQLDRTLRRQRGEYSPHLVVDPLAESTHDNHTQLLLADHRDSAFPVQPDGKGRNVLIQCRDSSRWAGKLFSLDRVEFASNYMMFVDQTGINTTTALVATGLLLAGDWKSTMLIVENVGALSREECADLIEICAAIGVRTRIVEKSAMEGMLKYGEA